MKPTTSQTITEHLTPRSEIQIVALDNYTRSRRAMFIRPLAFLWLCAMLSFLPLVNAQTTNVYYSGFETSQDLDDWAFSGTWQIGVPTFGPSTNSLGRRAYSGTNCAATVLGGNYTDNTTGRLESKSFVVPSAAHNPRLRFWHWYHFNCGDFGRIEIKVGAGNWVPLTNATFASQALNLSTSSGVWSQPGFDLSAYAGQTVQVGFFFSSSSGSGCGTSVAPGWYLDEVAVITGPVQTLVANQSEGFELGFQDWSVDGGTWEVGAPTAGPPVNAAGRRAHEGTNCAATVLSGNYWDNTSGRLVSPKFVVPSAGDAPRLRFWHWYFLQCGETGQVQIRTSGGNWQTLATYTSTSSGVWSQPGFDLSAYAGQTVQVGFFFSSSSGSGCGTSVAPGWYLDEVAVITGPVQTLVANQSEGFELGFQDWSVDGGTWEVGAPTAGPPVNAAGRRAHEGTNCAATVLSGDYWDNTSGRLVSPKFVVPSAGDAPRLRFWHWYFLQCGETGQVQIRTSGGNWQTLATYTSTSSGVWSQPGFDLSAYAGQTVQVGFFFSSSSGSGCGTSVAPGWYVDEVQLVTGPIVFNNPEDFETGLGNWHVEGGTWEVGAPTAGPPVNAAGRRAHEGTNCAATVLSGNYWDNTSGRLVSPKFVVPSAGDAPRLRFWHWYSFSCGDSGQVQIRVEAGAWQPLPNAAFASTSSGVWGRPSIDLSAFAGKSVQLGFHFNSSSGSGCGTSVAPGWYIDEVRLLHDASFALLDSPILRAQDTTCIPLGIAADTLTPTVNFTLQAPAGHLGNLTLNAEGCWSGGLASLAESQWLVSLTNSCPSAAMGVQTIGTLCFTAVSSQSAFVPLTISDLDAGVSPTHTYDSRAVVIANEPLLESWLGPERQRMLTLYGIAGKTYEIQHAPTVDTPMPWTPGWTHPVPASLFTSFQLNYAASNAPSLFLRAVEK